MLGRMSVGDRDWERTKTLFARACDTPATDREALLTAEGQADPALAAEVRSLLDHDADAAGFLDHPAMARLASGDTAALHRLTDGDRLDRYEIEAFIGAGAMSEVYRARDTRLGRTVAIKVLSDPTAPDAGGWLLREAQHASTLNHPHICAVHEVDECDGRPFIVLELIEGRTLLGATEPRPPLQTIVKWGAEIADALDHAHRRGVIHRDLKGSNVLVTEEQHVKVVDFGLARRMDADGSPRHAASVLADASVAGTLTHIAPEVLKGAPTDTRVDIWSLGVLLYELANGRVPFKGATAFATASAILDDTPEPLPSIVPPAFQRIVERCLSKDPEQRYSTAAEVRDALEALAHDQAARDRRPTTTWRAASAAVLIGILVTAALASRAALGGLAREDPEVVPLLAVLPIAEQGADETQRFLSEGLTEALTAELGRIDAIRVVAPGSTRAFRNRDDAVSAVARDTGARHVLTGSFTRNGPRIRLSVRLLSAPSAAVAWSADYDREARHVQALYGVVAREVAEAIRVELSADDADRLTRIRSVDPDVYESHLKGRFYWNQRTSESLKTAIGHYETAIHLDPSYAPAYAALADCYSQLGTQMVGGGSPMVWRPKARDAAIRALQIDPSLAEAHATLGYVRHYDWEWEAAEDSFRRAIALSPSYPLARIWYANLLSGRGRVDEALAQVTTASQLDPLSPIVGTNVAWVLINARRYDEAIATLLPIVERNPDYVQAHSRLGAAYSFTGRHGEAIRAAETANALAADSAATRAGLAQVLALSGQRQDAERLVQRLLVERERQYVPTGAIANVFAALGRVDDALQWLEQSHAERTNNNAYLAVEPVYDSLRSHERFRSLLRATGLP